jgi:N-methylhydantoinase A
LDAESFLGGGVRLDRERTEQMMRAEKGLLATVEEFAAGILRVVETQMEKAIRVISIERGHDPRQCTLVAFGGGGPLHACSLARALHIPRVLVPPMPGALSAVGILLADAVRDYSRTVMLPGDAIENLEDGFRELERQGTADFAAMGLKGAAHCSLDLRYCRQGYELNVAFEAQAPNRAMDAFHQLHRQRYGFCDVERPVEIVNIRLRMIAAAEPYKPARREPVQGDGSAARAVDRDVYFDGKFLPTCHYRRDRLVPGDLIRGPAMITEYTSATVMPPGSSAEVDGFGNLILTISDEERA